MFTLPANLVGKQNIHKVLLNGALIDSLIDTGSQVSIINEGMYQKFFNYLPLIDIPSILNVKQVNGQSLGYIGAVELFVTLGKNVAGTNEGVHVLFLVIRDDAKFSATFQEHLCLIGMNALEQLWRIRMTHKGTTYSELDSVFQTFSKVCHSETENHGFLGCLKASEDCILQPGEQMRMKARFHSKLVGIDSCILIEPNTKILPQDPVILNTRLSALTTVRVLWKNNTPNTLNLCKGADLGQVYLSPVPFSLSPEEVQLCAVNSDLSEYSEFDELRGCKDFLGIEEDDDEVSPDMKLLWDHVDSLSHLDSQEKEALLYCLRKNSQTFSQTDYDIGKVSGVKHSFVLRDDIPFKIRHRNLPPRKYAAAKEHLNQLLDKGIIRPSVSPYSSAPMFLEKSDGRIRMVTDLRVLNDKTVRDCYALPRFDDILPYLNGNKYFTKMDIRSGYYNIEIEETDKEKTAFSTPFGLYEYNRMVQGAKTSASTFQRCMENILRPMLYEGVIAFLDDVIIYSKTIEEHLELLDRVLKLMSDAGLKLHPGKCEMVSTKIVYLGYIITEEGVRANPEKTEVLTNWPKIRTVKDVMRFLGFCGFFRRFIPNYSSIAQPLIELTKGVKYKPKSKFGPPVKQPALAVSVEDRWSPACQQAREQLIESLTSPPLLKYPDLDKPFVLHVDACTTGLGAVLLQFDTDNKLHPVCYASRSLKLAEKNYPVYKLEFLALKWAVVDKFNFYLYGGSFKVYTDNNPLTYIHRSLKVDAVTQRWLTSLGDYNFTIHYKPGNTNIDADILSRLHETQDEAVEHVSEVVSTPAPLVDYIDVSNLDADCFATKALVAPADWRQLQLEDPELANVIHIIHNNVKCKPSEFPKPYRKLFFIRDQLVFNDNNVLCKKACIDGIQHQLIVLPKKQLSFVLKQLHDESGHFGTERVSKFFQQRFYSPGYTKAIDDYIASCKRCILKKAPVKRHGEMGEVSASRPFQVVSMDYLSLDMDKHGFGHVLVVTDLFTKFSFAIPTRNETATTVAKALLDNVFNIFGLPEKLLSDRGRNFESQIIGQLCTLLGVKKIFTCPYSPRSDAVCERFNRTLINMIGTLSTDKRTSWSRYITHLVNVYNNSVHSSTGFAPFELIFGRKSRLPVDIMLGTSPVETEYSSLKSYVQQLKSRLEFIFKIAQQSSDFSHLINKHRYDELIKTTRLLPGEKVLIRNVGVRGMHKLAPTWRPEVYEVIREVGDNCRVYEVKNVQSPRLKPKVLHIDMLKPISALEKLYRKSHEPEEEDYEDDLVQLFAEDGGSKFAGTISESGQKNSSQDLSSRQRATCSGEDVFSDSENLVGDQDSSIQEEYVLPLASPEFSELPQQAEHSDEVSQSNEDLSETPVREGTNDNQVDVVRQSESVDSTKIAPDRTEDVRFQDNSVELENLNQPQVSRESDSDMSDSSAELDNSPPDHSSGRPIRNRRRPNFFGNPILYMLRGGRQPITSGPVSIV